MAEGSRSGRVPWATGLAPALAAGLALRLWYYSDLSDLPFFGHPIVDSLTYDGLAREFLSGAWSGGFFRPPLYPLFLALIYRLGGEGQAAVVWVQFTLSLASVVPVYLLGLRWYGPAAASLAAWLTCLYPLRIFFEGEILAVTLFGFLLSVGMWLTWTGIEEVSSRRLAGGGAFLALAALTRPNILLALPLALAGSIPVLRGSSPVPWRPLLWFVVALALFLSPATLYNWAAERQFVPVAANGGINFYLGNQPGATGETPLPPGLKWQLVVQEPIRRGVTGLAEQDRYWWRRSLEVLGDAPGRWLSLLGRKVSLFYHAFESSNNKSLDYFSSFSLPVRHYRLWYGALLCLAVPALILAPLLPGTLQVASLLAGYSLAVSVFFVTARYRLPIVPFLSILAGAALTGGWEAARAGRWRLAAAAVGAAALTALAVFPPWTGVDAARIDPDFQMGQVYLSRREPLKAQEHLLRARQRSREDPDVLNSLGAARFALGDMAGAEMYYRAALEGEEYAEVHYNLGVVYERMGPGRRSDAVASYRRSLEINPLERRAAVNLLHLLRELPPTGKATP